MVIWFNKKSNKFDSEYGLGDTQVFFVDTADMVRTQMSVAKKNRKNRTIRKNRTESHFWHEKTENNHIFRGKPFFPNGKYGIDNNKTVARISMFP